MRHVVLMLIIMLMVGCQTSPTAKRVSIEADGETISHRTEAKTVREALAEAKITLNELDRVKPDLYSQLYPNLTINVTRVTEEIATETEPIPYEQQTVINEALAPDESRLAQLGVNGEMTISIRIVYEDGQPVSQTEIAREVTTAAIPEILVVGPQGELPSVSFDGTIAYLSNGNAWVLRENSASRRPLATEAVFDEHVFTLSPDGRYLLYTEAISVETDIDETATTTQQDDDITLPPLNQLTLANTAIVGEVPIPLGIEGVINATWAATLSPTLIAYSTAERTPTAPGWRANNDLWLVEPESDQPPLELIPPNTAGLYAWWGTTYQWSPDGTALAYARPDQIGIISIIQPPLTDTRQPLTYTITPLLEFAPLETFSEWAWVPHVTWSPDGQFIAATVHGDPITGGSPDSEQKFDLWLLKTDGTLSLKLREQVGMWSNPSWGVQGLAFGLAVDPLQSINSRYEIVWADWDGSNQTTLFPFDFEPGVHLPDLHWSADGKILMFAYNGNIYQTNIDNESSKQLTNDSQATHLQWATH